MAAILSPHGLDHGDHTHDSIESVTECILGLKDKADDKDLPGFGGLIDDWFNPDVEVDEEQFVRRFLRVFKQSDKDFTYEDILKGYDDEIQGIVNQFVDGEIDASEAAKRYTPFTTLKVPKGVVQKRGLANIIPGERNILEEHTALLRALPTSIPSRIRGLIAKIAPSLKDPKEYLYIPSYKHLEFENHGRTVRYTPTITCVPNTAQDIAEIVKYAKNKKMGVRVSGFRHSWSPVFGSARNKNENKNGDILISTLGLVDASILPNFTSLPTDLFQPEAKDLNSIMFVTHDYVNGPALSNGKRYVRVGTSTTNEQLRRWCVGTGKVTLPMQIIEVEITMGGSNATICHGAGLANATLSDLVRCIEYVDANGILRKIDLSTPGILRAAAGCFGLIGVVTHIVLEFDPMSCALMEPRKVPVVEAIPPPPDMTDSEIPAPLRPKKPLTKERKAQVQKDFETRALTHDYAEWFWFPYSSEVWVNTWKKTSDLTGAVDYPSNVKTVLQVFGTIMVNVAQNASILLNLTQALPEVQTKLLTWLTMKNLDDIGTNGKKIKTWVPDAIHFQRGVQNIRVRDLEIEFPLQPRRFSGAGDTTSSNNHPSEIVHEPQSASTNTTPTSGIVAPAPSPTIPKQEIDFTLVQRAWWDAILTCYQEIKTCPQRMPLEMRIMSGSDVTLAPQRGHRFGTCSIEILTLHNVADIWPAYAQKVLDKWSGYTDADGKSLPVRPHWAKEWYGYKMKGRPWQDVLKNEVRLDGGFREELSEWRGLVGQLAKRDGWRVEDAKKRFGNEALNALVWTEPVAKSAVSVGGVAGANGKGVDSISPTANGGLVASGPAKTNGHVSGTANGSANGTSKGAGGSKKDPKKKKKDGPFKHFLAKLKAAF